MEMTQFNLIANFNAGMKCLQNPSPFSRFPPFSSLDKIPLLFYSFWKWGALILALLTRFISRIKLFIQQIPVKSTVSCQESCSQKLYDDDDFDVSDDDEEDDASSCLTDSDDGSEDYRKPAIEVFREEGCGCYYGNDIGKDGSFTVRHCDGFSWSEFSAGESVVKLWDSLGFDLDVKDGGSEYQSDVPIWELGGDVKVISGEWCWSPVAAANVVVATGVNHIAGGVSGDPMTPAICAAWPPRQIKVCFKDDVAVTENMARR